MNALLEGMGFSKNETAVYLAFLKHKEKTAAEIARILSMDKSSCYRAVETLVGQGLLLTVPRRRGTTHTAASPELLKEIMKTRKQEMEKQEKALGEFVDKLMKDASDKRATYIRVEKGVQAVRDSQDANLEAALKGDKIIKESYRLDFPYFKDREHVAWVNAFARRRIKSGVAIRQLVNFAGQSVFAPIMKTDKKLLKEIRLMPPDLTCMHALRISGDFITIISFDAREDYIVITIRDRFIKALMENMFDFIWNRSEIY